MNRNKTKLARFFSHDITLLVLSFVLAFSTWFIISAVSETDANVAVTGIPVIIELSEDAENDGLQVFGGDDLTASVEVSGNRVTVGSLSPSDIQIVANQTGSIIAPGTYTLPLSAKKTGIKTNYNIVSTVTPATVTVFVDRFKEEEFSIDNRLSVQLEDSNHYASTSISQNTVNISGPETQVAQIAGVVVTDTITFDSDDTKTVQEKLHFLDADGKELDLPLVTSDVETIEATITVLPVMNVKLAIDTIGAPENCPTISLDPESVKIAGPQSVLDTIEDGIVSIGVLDFSKLKNQNHSFSYDITLPNGCKVLSNENTASVSVNLSSYVKTSVGCKITAKFDSSNYTADFATDSVTVILYGPESLISTITASDVSVVADFRGMEIEDVTSNTAVSISVPLTITLSDAYAKCWVYGSYTTTANVSLK
jgi:YbbR domain-containing protein